MKLGGEGGLRLPETLAGIGASEQEDIHLKWSTYEAIKNEIEMRYGMMPIQEPAWAPPTLTLEDLTEKVGKDYTEKYLQVTAWYGYLSEVKARISAQLLEIDNEMNHIESSMREKMRDRSTKTTKGGDRKAPPIAEMTDKIRLDTRYSDLSTRKQGFEQMKVIISARVDKHEYEIKLLSRQVEIKRTEFDHAQREGGISGQRGAPLRTPGNSGMPRGMSRE